MELISAAYLLPMDGEPIPDGAIAVEQGTIRAIGPAATLRATYPEAMVRDFPRHVLLPGLINAHCHIDLTNFVCEEFTPQPTTDDRRPTTDSLHLHWLTQSIAYKQSVPLAQLAAGVERGLRQLVQAGTTCAGLYTGYDGIAPLIETAGIRAVLYPEIFASGPGDRAQDRFESALAILEEHGDRHPNRLRIGLGPVAPYLLSRHLLRIISQHAKHAAIPLQVHAAESFAEMEFFFDSTGPIGTQLFPAIGWGAAAGGELPPPFHKTPIQYLHEIGFLDAAPAIIGSIHLGGNDFSTLAKHGCRAIYCPRANALFGHGTFPLAKLTEHGIGIGLATEATTHTADGSLWEEMRVALDQHNTAGKTILQMATLGGARALGWEHRMGSLTAGKMADFILCDCPDHTELPFLYDALIRQTTALRVRHAVIGGQWVKTT